MHTLLINIQCDKVVGIYVVANNRYIYEWLDATSEKCEDDIQIEICTKPEKEVKALFNALVSVM